MFLSSLLLKKPSCFFIVFCLEIFAWRNANRHDPNTFFFFWVFVALANQAAIFYLHAARQSTEEDLSMEMGAKIGPFCTNNKTTNPFTFDRQPSFFNLSRDHTLALTFEPSTVTLAANCKSDSEKLRTESTGLADAPPQPW